MIRRITVFLFHALLLIIPLFFTTANDELFEFNKIILLYIFTALIVGTWIMRMIADNVVYWKKTPFDLPIGIFFCSQIISTVLSIHPNTSIFGYYTRFNGGLLSLFSYLALYYAFVNTFEKKEIAGFIGTTLYAGLISSLYAFVEHFGHSPSCLFITGNFDVSCWIQDVKSRVFGTFGQPNWLAAYLIMLIPFLVSRVTAAWMSRQTWIVLWNAILLSIFLSTLLFTQSRSGILGLGVGGVVYVGVIAWCAWKNFSIRHRDGEGSSLQLPFQHSALSAQPLTKKERKKLEKRVQHVIPDSVSFSSVLAPLLLTVCIGVGLALIFGTPVTPSFATIIKKLQMQTKTEQVQSPDASSKAAPTGGTQLEVGGTESGVIRAVVWKGAIAVWKRHPLFGSGVETFAYSYYKDRPMEHNTVSEWDFLYNKAHNEFLNYLATTGLVGLLSYMLLIGWVSLWILRNSHQHPLFAGALLFGYTALHVSNFFGFSTVVVSLLFYLVPALGLLVLLENTDRATPQHATLSGYQWVGILLTACVSIYVATIPLNMWRADASYAEAKRLLAAGKGDHSLKEIQKAITISPVAQGEFQEELGHITSELSISAYKQQQGTMSADLGEMAIRATDEMLQLNPRHLNFYKSRARVLLTLSQIAPDLMKEVLNILNKAQDLAPTDAKLVYNRALLHEQLGDKEQAVVLMKQALEMKPNYDGAWDQLKRIEGK